MVYNTLNKYNIFHIKLEIYPGKLIFTIFILLFLLLLVIRVKWYQTWLYSYRVKRNFYCGFLFPLVHTFRTTPNMVVFMQSNGQFSMKKQFFLKNYSGNFFFTIFILLFLLLLAICVQWYQTCVYLCRVKWTILNEKRTRNQFFL